MPSWLSSSILLLCLAWIASTSLRSSAVPICWPQAWQRTVMSADIASHPVDVYVLWGRCKRTVTQLL